MMTAMHEARSRVLLPPMFGPVSSRVRAGVAGEPSCRSFATMQPPRGARAHGCHTCRLVDDSSMLCHTAPGMEVLTGGSHNHAHRHQRCCSE